MQDKNTSLNIDPIILNKCISTSSLSIRVSI